MAAANGCVRLAVNLSMPPLNRVSCAGTMPPREFKSEGDGAAMRRPGRF